MAAAPLNSFSFELEARSEAARAGAFSTPHGSFYTPAFMPVGTHGAVKALTSDQVRATSSEIVLANTYHLALRPGEKTVEKLGGLHRFMGWDGPILTDSGGFQVFRIGERYIWRHMFFSRDWMVKLCEPPGQLVGKNFIPPGIELSAYSAVSQFPGAD